MACIHCERFLCGCYYSVYGCERCVEGDIVKSVSVGCMDSDGFLCGCKIWMCLGREIMKSVYVGCMDSDGFLCGCERCVWGER